ncbi:Planctomycete cytochrome C [Anatilimnocola aggregata]|uniref:Planctomycete cytochrome C n=1 Tax=Anatilimnocola aggregata TaxID=2528021 RepID=A0A517YDQ5_9BACT|nr:PSD1 and planctomycete cytochrome C domain-containing protein [Anatilimnocola aggregata]QDU28365.1 Planctomycete cytochrome C [Anatilimnocola aggregata]
MPRTHRSNFCQSIFPLLVVCNATMVSAQAPSAEDVKFFENKIRPVLVKHCYECHSKDSKEVGGKLLVDSRDGLHRGGESGPALVAGKPAKSLLIQAVQYDGLQMPPDQPLPEAVVNDLIEWVRRGAPDPRQPKAVAVRQRDGSTVSGNEPLWSLQPIQNPAVPDVLNAEWPRDPLDRFVLARIEAAKLTPTADAEPRKLARRLYFDLVGLPPTMSAVEAFVADYESRGPEATANLIDQLLASPQFGERWGRYWLDVARYGESNGNDGLSRNPTFPHAWRYRDYVIQAFNADTPFDQFVTEQIAGDLLPDDSPEQKDRQRIATGFLALGSKPAKAMNANFEMDVVADQIDAIGRGILGLSVACARCHDHKFDPIPTRDYYALAGIFTSTETMWGTAAHEGLTAPATDLHVLQTAPHTPPPKDFVETVAVTDSNTGKPKTPPKSKWKPGTPLAMGVRDRAKPADTKVNIKGEMAKTGEVVPRGFLTACELAEKLEVDATQSGRLQLAKWITHPSHPLTARVLANRIWLQLFGAGIVTTPDDFGVYGERPTHPELLDHLATRLKAGNWSIKQLIRAIVLSRTYQLASDADAKLIEGDPQNRLLTRHSRRRLDAEMLRDSMLQVSGQLQLQPAEGSLVRHRDILVNLAGNLHQPSNHRSIYLCYLRSSPPPELAAFDLPDFASVIGQRDVSTVPNQALHLYNSPFVIEQSNHFAQWVLSETASAEGRLRSAWERALGREPNQAEIAKALELVRLTETELADEDKAWASFCQALLIANEFRYVD